MEVLDKPLFYHPYLDIDTLTLSEEESRHCISSLRLKAGETIFLTDGKGTLAEAIITVAHPKAGTVQIQKRNKADTSPVTCRLIIAPPKAGERLDWLVEKVTEIGIGEIQFITCRYSERDKINLERLRKIAISAMKQSKQVRIPSINNMISWKEFLNQQLSGHCFIAYVKTGETTPTLAQRLTALPLEQLKSGITILIGPEGDFSEKEIEEALHHQCIPVSLGHNVLRTETAAVYAAAVLTTIL